MAFKINIRADIEAEMEELLKTVPVRSKTEYINEAIAQMNLRLKRKAEIGKLKDYFRSSSHEARKIMNEFQNIRRTDH